MVYSGYVELLSFYQDIDLKFKLTTFFFLNEMKRIEMHQDFISITFVSSRIVWEVINIIMSPSLLLSTTTTDACYGK